MIETAKKMLYEGDCTLVVANHGQASKFYNRGVNDLFSLLSQNPSLLSDACVADKMVGKASAALMITGGVREVFAKVVTRDARNMLESANIPISYDSETDFVKDRTKTGRCPLDTLCSSLSEPCDMVFAIRLFLNKHKQ